MCVDYMLLEQSEEVVIQDLYCLVQCQVCLEFFWVQYYNGIFCFCDGGLYWQGVVVELFSFGFVVVVYLWQLDMVWFVLVIKDECCIFRDVCFVVICICDGGYSFEIFECGLFDGLVYDLVYCYGLDIDFSGECLVMGLIIGGLWFSENGGEDWQQFFVNLLFIYCVCFV